MSTGHLKLFRDIAQSRSISRGASINGISQSAASQHLQELEKGLDVTLLDRSTRPLALTEEGKLYLAMCRDMLRREDEFRAALDALKSDTQGVVRIAAIYSVGLSEMADLEKEFRRRFPAARLEVSYLRPEKVYAAVIADAADLGMVSYPEVTREVHVIPWREEEMVVAAAPDHPLASRARLRAADLAGAEFIGFDEDLPIRREIDRFLREHNVEVKMTVHFDNLQMIKEAVALRSGISIMPARIMEQDIAQGRLKAIPLAPPGLVRPLGIIHRRKKRFHRAAQAFLDLLQTHPTAPALALR